MKPATAASLRELRRHPAGLTAMDALDLELGDSFAQRVHELRAEGFVISDTWETTARGARVKRYALVEEPFRAGWPIGRVRECPSCHDRHAAGTTCAWRGVLSW